MQISAAVIVQSSCTIGVFVSIRGQVCILLRYTCTLCSLLCVVYSVLFTWSCLLCQLTWNVFHCEPSVRISRKDPNFSHCVHVYPCLLHFQQWNTGFYSLNKNYIFTDCYFHTTVLFSLCEINKRLWRHVMYRRVQRTKNVINRNFFWH